MKRLFIKFTHRFKDNPKKTIFSSFNWFIRIPYYYLLYPIILSQNVFKTNRYKISELSKDLDVLIVSPGGVATTFLLRYVSTFMKTNDIHDLDGLKHITPAPEFNFRKDLKVVYLTGELSDIENSLVKRGWLFEQYIKLGGHLHYFCNSKKLRSHFKVLVSGQLKTFKTLSKNNENVMIINYNELWDLKKELANFLSLDPQNFVKAFPEKRSRALLPY